MLNNFRSGHVELVKMVVPKQLAGGLWPLLAGLVLSTCSQYQSFDSVAYLHKDYADKVPKELRDQVEIPYSLDETTLAEIDGILSPAGSEKRRTDQIVDFIFGGLDLQYSLTPTKNASETFATREGNCLAFVNLFVGIARHQRLNPFYVEVEDYQRWNYQGGTVISRGHIVAGLNIDGELSTFDFLPYRPKGYRDFEPIDDLTAMAHYYNNLGAEALMRGDVGTARDKLRIAYSLAPDFEKGVNNLGVLYLRLGDAAAAIELFERGLELYPESVPLLSNQARALQELGRQEEADEVLARIEDVNRINPFFFVYRGEMALGQGDTETALVYMRKALRTDSEVPEVHLGLAKVFFAIGDTQRARHHVERALKLDATNEEARKFAVMLYGGDSSP